VIIVIIAIGSILLNQVTIGDNSIVGAGGGSFRAEHHPAKGQWYLDAGKVAKR